MHRKNYRGILEYTDILIRVQTKSGQIRLSGKICRLNIIQTRNEDYRKDRTTGIYRWEKDRDDQSLFRYLKGYVKIRITGYSPERFRICAAFTGSGYGN